MLAKWNAQARLKQETQDELQLQAENPGRTGRKRQRTVHETLESPERHREFEELSESEFAHGRALAPTKLEFGKARPK